VPSITPKKDIFRVKRGIWAAFVSLVALTLYGYQNKITTFFKKTFFGVL
jgi:hypothetical protein